MLASVGSVGRENVKSHVTLAMGTLTLFYVGKKYLKHVEMACPRSSSLCSYFKAAQVNHQCFI